MYMADELELELENENINRTEERIKNLSSKVKDVATERDEAKRLADEATAKAQAAERERDFYAGLSDVLPKYPAAAEFKDAIKEKVMQGYTIDDAAVSVLNREGKLVPIVDAAPAAAEPAAGGSAPTAMSGPTEKSFSEMTLAEKREALADPALQSDLEKILRRF